MPARMHRTLPNRGRLDIVKDGFRSLPDRYLGAPAGFDATYRIKLCDLGHTWEVSATRTRLGCARVRRAAAPM